MRVFAIDKADFSERFAIQFAGASWIVKTNSTQLRLTLELAAIGTNGHAHHSSESALTLSFHVNDADDQRSSKPHFRGQGHVVIATFGVATVFVFDMLRRHISATLTPKDAGDVKFWREMVLPICIGLMGATIGVLPVHCASFTFAEDGLLIAGHSGAGKSTLSAELCQAAGEVEYLADDWTYIGLQGQHLSAHGVGARIKLLPDAVRYFDALSGKQPSTSLNGELAYEVQPEVIFAAKVRYQCRPRWLVFLERVTGHETTFTPLSREHAQAYLEQSVERLPSLLSEAVSLRATVMSAVADLPAWRFRCGGSPKQTAAELRRFVSTLQHEESRT